VPGVQVVPLAATEEAEGGEAMTEERTALTVAEKTQLEQSEAVIASGLVTFADVGRDLLKIRDGRLYKVGFSTFEAYCKARWDMGKAHAYRLIEAANVVSSLSPMGDKPTNERQVRALVTVPMEERQGVWTAATERAKEAGRPVTAADVKKEVETKKTHEDKRPKTAEQEEEMYLGKDKEAGKKKTPAKAKGVGVQCAGEAIAALQKIPPKDGLRSEAWRMMRAWLDHNE
jgi:hypothetical protein